MRSWDFLSQDRKKVIRNTQQVIMDGEFGWWCESNDAEKVKELVERALTTTNDDQILNEWAYLKEHYSSQKSYEIITAAIR